MKQSSTKTRIGRLKSFLEELKLDAFLVSSVPNITYLTNFSGFLVLEREAFLLITKTKQYAITDGRYKEAVLKNVKDFELIERTPDNSLEQIFKSLTVKHKIKRLGIEESNINVLEYKSLKKAFETLVNFNIDSLRAVKDVDEIKAIEKACRIGDQAFSQILEDLRIGVREKEIAFELESFIKSKAAGLSFPPCVAFGANSSMPHHQTSNKKLSKNDKFVLLDFGVKIDNYCSDMTRTVFIGKPTNEQKKIYQTVYEAQRLAIEQLNNLTIQRKQTKASYIDSAARKYIIEHGYPTIPHSLGHGIGIEVHEDPRLRPKSKNILKPGMVFTIEPGIYMPGFGGVRIEDVLVMEKSGPKFLTKSKRGLIQI